MASTYDLFAPDKNVDIFLANPGKGHARRWLTEEGLTLRQNKVCDHYQKSKEIEHGIISPLYSDFILSIEITHSSLKPLLTLDLIINLYASMIPVLFLKVEATYREDIAS